MVPCRCPCRWLHVEGRPSRISYATVPADPIYVQPEPMPPGVANLKEAHPWIPVLRYSFVYLCLSLSLVLLCSPLYLRSTQPSLTYFFRRPSSLQEKSVQQFWCQTASNLMPIWQPSDLKQGVPAQVKVLTYNLEWWALFGKSPAPPLGVGGIVDTAVGAAAGKLVGQSGKPQPFDIMGFQECEDPVRVLRDAGLSDEYHAIQGSAGLCVAYRQDTWDLVAQGETFVAEDLRTAYFGKRSVQWIRVLHQVSGRIVFFANHHGPLGINSGGICGGQATAQNILNVIRNNGVHGDAIILVGDFNANAASPTLAELGNYLHKAFAGVAYGGIDNIFTNLPGYHDAQNLGGGGSDHSALSVVMVA